MPIIYSQKISGPDGYVMVDGCATRNAAVHKAVDMAIKSGWHPPRWWEFWLPQWSDDCVIEYRRRNV